MKSLAESSLGEKLLYTGFLLLMGIGYLMALAYLYTSHAGYDGKPGVSVEDIAYTYYGNRSGTRLEAAIRSSMAAYLQAEERKANMKFASVPSWPKTVLPVTAPRQQQKFPIFRALQACANSFRWIPDCPCKPW
jgi:hypothetical protein